MLFRSEIAPPDEKRAFPWLSRLQDPRAVSSYQVELFERPVERTPTTKSGGPAPSADLERSQAAQEAAAALRPEIQTLHRQVERLASEHRHDIDSISDPQLRRSLGSR